MLKLKFEKISNESSNISYSPEYRHIHLSDHPYVSFVTSDRFWNKMLKDCGYDDLKTALILIKYVKNYVFDLSNVDNNLYIINKVDNCETCSNLFGYMSNNCVNNIEKLFAINENINFDMKTTTNNLLDMVYICFNNKYSDIKIMIDLVEEKFSVYRIFIKNKMLMSIDKVISGASLDIEEDSFNKYIDQIKSILLNDSDYQFYLTKFLDRDFTDYDYEYLSKFMKSYIPKGNNQTRKLIESNSFMTQRELREIFAKTEDTWTEKMLDGFIKKYSELPVFVNNITQL